MLYPKSSIWWRKYGVGIANYYFLEAFLCSHQGVPYLSTWMVENIVEKNRAYQDLIGQHSSQIRFKTKKVLANINDILEDFFVSEF